MPLIFVSAYFTVFVIYHFGITGLVLMGLHVRFRETTNRSDECVVSFCWYSSNLSKSKVTESL